MNELKQYISICCRWTFYIHTDQSIPYAWRAFISFFFLIALSLSWMALSIFLFQFLYFVLLPPDHVLSLTWAYFSFFILFLLLKRLLLLFYSILTECEKIYWIPISRFYFLFFLFFTFCFLSFDLKHISQERCVTFEVRRNLNCAYSAADCI